MILMKMGKPKSRKQGISVKALAELAQLQEIPDTPRTSLRTSWDAAIHALNCALLSFRGYLLREGEKQQRKGRRMNREVVAERSQLARQAGLAAK